MRFYKLQFLSALHVDSKGSGEPESVEEFIHSDTLSAALTLSWKTLYPDCDQNLFLNPPFKVSSAFPYIEDVLLFPVPNWPLWSDIDPSQRKRFKKINWISQTLLEKILNKDPLSLDRTIFFESGIALDEADREKCPSILHQKPWAISERQRVAVDRVGSAQGGNTFFFGLKFFAEYSGLYFLAQGDEENLDKLESALAFLGDSGLGADRNSGLGHFKVRRSAKLDIRCPDSELNSICLSLFNPSNRENMQDLLKNSAYGLQTRSGWIVNSTVGRPPIRVFTEGSFFSGIPQGRIVNMLDQETIDRHKLPLDHLAPRDFRAFVLPCKKPEYLDKERA